MMRKSELDRILFSEKPSEHFEKLRQSGRLPEVFPELNDLIGAKQNHRYHLEDVWEHTMMVLDLAAGIKDRSSYPAGFMYGALLHDIGKPATFSEKISKETGEVVYHNIGHPKAGAKIAADIMDRLGAGNYLKKYVECFVRYHDTPLSINDQLAWNGNKINENIDRLIHLRWMPDYVLFNREADSVGVIPGSRSGRVPVLFLKALSAVHPEVAARYLPEE